MRNQIPNITPLLACVVLAAMMTTSCTTPITPTACTLDNNVCNQDQYCMFTEETCGQDNLTGTCQSLPEICTEIFSPVCGCDGQTYANECLAAGAGINIQSSGECTEN